MTTILRSIGQNLRVVGPLTLVNRFLNPNFEVYDVSNVPAYWTTVGHANLISATGGTTPPVRNRYGQLSFYDPGVVTGVEKNGIQGHIADQIVPGQDYYLSASFFLASSLATSIKGDIDFLDSSGGVLTTVTNTLINSGVSSTSWLPTSAKYTAPADAAFADARFYISWDSHASGVPANVLMSGMMFCDQELPYIDGDTAGYVWASDLYNSQTLQSGRVSDLHFFNPSNITVVD